MSKTTHEMSVVFFVFLHQYIISLYGFSNIAQAKYDLSLQYALK